MSKAKTDEKIKMFIKEHLPIGYRAEKERTAHHRASFFVVLQTGERLTLFLTGLDENIMADRTVK